MANIFAAAGVAEAVWAMEACTIFCTMGVIGVVTVFALALLSRGLAVTAAVLQVFATLCSQP